MRFIVLLNKTREKTKIFTLYKILNKTNNIFIIQIRLNVKKKEKYVHKVSKVIKFIKL